MDNYTTAEQAYKNGFEAGYKLGREDAVNHAHLVFGDGGICMCSDCLTPVSDSAAFCHNCGAMMDEPPTEDAIMARAGGDEE